MRLYLSSFRMGNQPEQILQLTDGRHAAIVANACDDADEPTRAEAVQRETDSLAALGFTSEEIDLRHYFGKQGQLADKLTAFDFIWVRGGNTFVLRRAFRASGFDIILQQSLTGDTIAYGGYSAGIDILQPHLHGVELVDDPSVVPEGYASEVIWDCLGLLPYCVAPHYQSDHPESADIDRTVDYYIQNHIPFIALKDGQAIVVNGDKQIVVG